MEKQQQRRSRQDLERERSIIEQEMARLEQEKSKRRLILQRERIKTLLERDVSSSSIDTYKNTTFTIPSTLSLASSEESRGASCGQCCRKDRIIHRQQREIESLRRQLMEMQATCVPHDLFFAEDEASVVSEVTHL